jgi:hypothetical protein
MILTHHVSNEQIQYQYYGAYGMNNTYGIQLFSEVINSNIRKNLITTPPPPAHTPPPSSPPPQQPNRNNQETAYKIERAVPRCISLIHSCQHAGKAACILSRVFCATRILEYFPVKERNIYDIRKACEHPPLCYDFDHVGAWLDRPEVREARGFLVFFLGGGGGEELG